MARKKKGEKAKLAVDGLIGHIEAIIFVSDQEVTVKDLTETLKRTIDEGIAEHQVEAVIEVITEKFASDNYAFSLVPISNGYRFLTKAEYHKTISSFLNIKSRKRLSTAAMETLAIIAYKQPMTKGQIEEIRGVNCDYSIQKLLEKELVEIAGRAETVGRPLLYITSKQFMDHFGLKSVKDLPKIKEVVPQENQIGPSEIEETIPTTNQETEGEKPSEEKLPEEGNSQEENGTPENQEEAIREETVGENGTENIEEQPVEEDGAAGNQEEVREEIVGEEGENTEEQVVEEDEGTESRTDEAVESNDEVQVEDEAVEDEPAEDEAGEKKVEPDAAEDEAIEQSSPTL